MEACIPRGGREGSDEEPERPRELILHRLGFPTPDGDQQDDGGAIRGISRPACGESGESCRDDDLRRNTEMV